MFFEMNFFSSIPLPHSVDSFNSWLLTGIVSNAMANTKNICGSFCRAGEISHKFSPST